MWVKKRIKRNETYRQPMIGWKKMLKMYLTLAAINLLLNGSEIKVINDH